MLEIITWLMSVHFSRRSMFRAHPSPKLFWQLENLSLHGIGMIKKSSKVRGLYQRLATSRMSRRNHYLYSSVVMATINSHFCVVFVSKRGSKGSYLLFTTTKTNLRS